MKLKLSIVSTFLFLVCLFAFNQVNASEYNNNWPTWRGPLFTGEVVKGNPPTDWSETKNVKWKVPIPGRGLSTPVIWGDQMFITSTISTDKKAPAETSAKPKQGRSSWMQPRLPEYQQQFVLYSINRKNGKIIWKNGYKEKNDTLSNLRSKAWDLASHIKRSHEIEGS